MSRRYILTALVVACIFGAGFVASREITDPLARDLATAAAALFALAVIRSSLIKPYLVNKHWRLYGEDRGFSTTVGRHGEPRMVGDMGGVNFIVAQSTSLLGGGGGYYARTVVSATIHEGVPDGLRVYRRDALEWMHQLSGLRAVETGDDAFDVRMMVEGADAVDTSSWLNARREVFDDLAERYPRFIVHGAEVEGVPAASGGASGAVTLIVVGRRSTAPELDAFIGAACEAARALGDQTILASG